MATKKSNGHQCCYCGKEYKKADFSFCPFCGGDGGGTTPKVWKPNKAESKKYAKKMATNEK